MTPEELRASTLLWRMQPDQARKILCQLRGHINGMLAANGDTKKILWHYKRLSHIIQGSYRSISDLAQIALISSFERDWWVPIVEAHTRENEERIAAERKGRSQCPECLPLCHDVAPWVLPGEECPGCTFRRDRDRWEQERKTLNK